MSSVALSKRLPFAYYKGDMRDECAMGVTQASLGLPEPPRSPGQGAAASPLLTWLILQTRPSGPVSPEPLWPCTS